MSHDVWLTIALALGKNIHVGGVNEGSRNHWPRWLRNPVRLGGRRPTPPSFPIINPLQPFAVEAHGAVEAAEFHTFDAGVLTGEVGG